MKKTIILALSFICLVSCTNEWRNNCVTNERRLNNIDCATRFEYDGHKYIMFYQYGNTNYTNKSGVVHDPDCPCNNK